MPDVAGPSPFLNRPLALGGDEGAGRGASPSGGGGAAPLPRG